MFQCAFHITRTSSDCLKFYLRRQNLSRNIAFYYIVYVFYDVILLLVGLLLNTFIEHLVRHLLNMVDCSLLLLKSFDVIKMLFDYFVDEH